jgi:hypothetical protein
LVASHSKNLNPPSGVASNDLVALPEGEAKAKLRASVTHRRRVPSDEQSPENDITRFASASAGCEASFW